MAWAPAYVTADELKAFVRIDDATDDTQVALAIDAASRAVDRHTRRQFGKADAPTARRYTAYWESARWVVAIDDLMTTAGLAVTVPAGVVTGYDLEPINAAADGRPWTRLVIASTVAPTGAANEVTVTGTWGWTAVPPAVKAATLLQASRFLARRESPYGIAGSPDQGSELRLLAKLDPDVAVMLGPYTNRQWVFA